MPATLPLNSANNLPLDPLTTPSSGYHGNSHPQKQLDGYHGNSHPQKQLDGYHGNAHPQKQLDSSGYHGSAHRQKQLDDKWFSDHWWKKVLLALNVCPIHAAISSNIVQSSDGSHGNSCYGNSCHGNGCHGNSCHGNTSNRNCSTATDMSDCCNNRGTHDNNNRGIHDNNASVELPEFTSICSTYESIYLKLNSSTNTNGNDGNCGNGNCGNGNCGNGNCGNGNCGNCGNGNHDNCGNDNNDNCGNGVNTYSDSLGDGDESLGDGDSLGNGDVFTDLNSIVIEDDLFYKTPFKFERHSGRHIRANSIHQYLNIATILETEEENEDGSYEEKESSREEKESSREDLLENEQDDDEEEDEIVNDDEDDAQEEVVALQSVLPSLQGRRGAVHTGINVTDKDRFKIPFMLKRKNERKLSRTELSEMVKEFRSDKPHPLDRLKMSHWSELMSEETQPEMKSTEYKRRDALWGLFRAELVYLTDQLKIIRDVFQGTLKIAKDNGLLSDIDENTLFPNVNKLYKVSNAFSLDLYKMFTEGNAEDDSVVAAFDEFAKKFHQPFQRYCLNYTRAAKYLKALSKDRDFREYEKVCLEDVRCKKRQLSDLLICPMQHLMRYVILLQDIAKHVPENGKMELREAIETIQISLRSLESKLGTLQNFQRLQELDTLIIWPKVVEMDKTMILPEELKAVLSNDQSETTLCSDGRHMLHAGALVSLEYPKSTEVHTFLFDDMLLLTRTNTSLRKANRSSVFPIKTEQQTQNNTSPQCQSLMDVMETSGGLYDPKKRYLVYKQPISLDELQVHDITSAPGGCRHCFSITTFNRLKYCTAVYTFNAHSADNKTLWINSIRKASDEFIISHPSTPITSRQRSESSGPGVCRGNSDVSSIGSRNSIVTIATNSLVGGQLKEPKASIKKGTSIKNPTMRQKLPKRCKSS